MAEQPPVRLLPLDEEIEGDRTGTKDLVFRRIGDSVPLKPTDSAFDLSDPPSRPLAVSDSSGVLFLAHTQGFLVARTKDMIKIAKEIKENGKGPCVQGSSLADVPIGRVSILALSKDSTTLAAVVGTDLSFFSVASLLDKVEEPFFSCSVSEAGAIKDLKWRKSAEKSFMVLSSHSCLYHGYLKDQPKVVMDNVDAVDWSVGGDFVAVAKNNSLSILSSDFKEQLKMSLLFKSWPNEAGLKCNIKVDAINWVRDHTILVGCFRVDETGNEDGYLVQVITSRKYGFAERSCTPVVYSFPDVFGAISDDMLPAGGGPYLLSSFLDRWDIILASNKKAIDEHFVYFGLLVDDNVGEVVSLDFQNEMFPRIGLQENGDDNLILGLGVDKISLYEKVIIQVGSEVEERSPYCILMCLTSEGKLIMFHAVRITESSDLPPAILSHPGDLSSTRDEASTTSSLETEWPTSSSRLKDDVEGVVRDIKLSQVTTETPNVYPGKEIHFTNFEASKVEVSSIPTGHKYQSGDGSIGPSANHNQLPGGSLRKIGQEVSSSHSGKGVGSTVVVGNKNSAVTSAVVRESTNRFISSEMRMGLGPISTWDASVESQSTGKFFVGGPTTFLSDSQGKTDISKGEKLAFPTHNSPSAALAFQLPSGGPLSLKSSTKEPSSLMVSPNKTNPVEGHSSSGVRTGSAESVPSLRGPTALTREGSFPTKSLFFNTQSTPSRTFKSSQVLDSEPEISKQFYSVKDMVNELDNLLSSIEKEGGFKDACTVHPKSSILALEEGLENIFEMSSRCKGNVEEKLTEIQHLQQKMLQISARQVYMEGIIKQASNDQYWDIWNRQKLSPEFELKRQNIFNAYKNLTSQIIELERHFSSVEINKFGETGRVITGPRASQSSLQPSRQTPSLHNVYNTLSSQLAAAQQLSECLSNQMAVLNLNSPSVKRQNVAKELFESIGLTHGASTFQSPDIRRLGTGPESFRRVQPSPSKTIKEHPSRNTSSALKSIEPETARRRRDSLDRSLVNFEPQKTTVKRMLQGRQRDGAETPFRTPKEGSRLQVDRYDISQLRSNETPAFSPQSLMDTFQTDAYRPSKELQEKPSKQALVPQSNSVFKWANDSGSSHSLGSKSDTMHVYDSNTRPSFSLYSGAQDNTESSGLPGLTSTGYLGDQSNSSVVKSFAVSKTTSSVQFERSAPKQTSSPKNTILSGKDQPNQLLTTKIGAGSLAKSFQRSTKDKGETGDQLNGNIGEGDLTRALQRSTKDLEISQERAISDERNISSLSPVSDAPSAGLNRNSGNADRIANRNELVESVSTAVSKVSVPTISLPVPSDSPTSSVISTSVKPSSPSNLFSNVAFGASLDNKSTGEATSVLSSMSSAQSAFSSGLSSFQSQTPPNLSSSIERSRRALPSNSIGTSSKTELGPDQAPSLAGSLSQSEINSNHESSKSEVPTKEVFGDLVFNGQPSLLSNGTGGMFPVISNSSHEISSVMEPTSTSTTTGKDGGVDTVSTQEDEMEEEAPDTTSMLNLGALGGFGSAPPSSTPKSNPFGGSFVTATTSSVSPLFSQTASPGQLFRPASFNIPSAQSVQQPQTINSSGLASGYSGFGQPAQLGSGQQALGSVLGSFGQSRQIGAGVPGFGFASANSGGFGSAGGFVGAASGGGFTSLPSSSSGGGGFAGAAASGGGFAAAGAAGGGFAAAASGGGGFAAAASAGGGFGGAAPGGGFGGVAPGGSFGAGGFGAFSSNQGGGFSAFGGGSVGAGKPPAELLTQMRK